MKYKKIIFVSEDDTYRSPIAAAFFKSRMLSYSVSVESRGMVVLFEEPPNPKGVQLMKQFGLDISRHKSKQITENDFGSDALVIMMTGKGKRAIYEQFKNAVNVYTLKEFLGIDGDIDRPYGKSIEEYRENVLNLRKLVIDFAELLISEENSDYF